MKKRILYIITQAHWGGAQKYVRDLALNLPQDRFEVFVAVGDDQPLNRTSSGAPAEKWLLELEDSGIQVIHLKHLKRDLNIWHDFLSGFELFGLYRRLKPDIIHLNSSKVGAVGSVVTAIYNLFIHVSQRTSPCQSAMTKVVYTVHGLVLNEPLPLWRKIYYWLAEWLGSKFTNIMICVSEHDRESVIKWRLASTNKIKVIHNGIDFENLKFLPKKQARESLLRVTGYELRATHLIGSIAGLYKTKGLEYLIEAIHLLVTDYGLQVTCLIIGSGPARENLERLIKKNNLQEKIILTGSVDNAAAYLKAFDVFVLPSVKEGLSYTLIEARAAALAIIATDVGGNSEIIKNKETGVLIPPVDSKILAAKIAALIKHQDLREKLSQQAAQNLQQFTLERMIEKTLNLY